MTPQERTNRLDIACNKVADLWIEQMQKPFNKDNGDDDSMLFLLAGSITLKAQETLSMEKLALFKAELTSEFKRYADKLEAVILSTGTDYNPDELLYNAISKAGIDPSVLPWKSNTRIYLIENKIDYKFGYSASYQTIPIIDNVQAQPNAPDSDTTLTPLEERLLKHLHNRVEEIVGKNHKGPIKPNLFASVVAMCNVMYFPKYFTDVDPEAVARAAKSLQTKNMVTDYEDKGMPSLVPISYVSAS